MKEWMRYLCPSYIGVGYGNWVGAKRTSKYWNIPEPIDAFDNYGMEHDFALYQATTDEQRKTADMNLYQGWKETPECERSKSYPLWFFRLYRKGLLRAFKP